MSHNNPSETATRYDTDISHIDTGDSFSHGNLKIWGIWARPALKHHPSAVYLTLHNTGGQPERFLGASTEFADAVEIHEIRMEGDLMQMQRVTDGVGIPGGRRTILSPGGYHLMLINLQVDLRQGDRLPLLLKFERSGEIMVDVLVTKP